MAFCNVWAQRRHDKRDKAEAERKFKEKIFWLLIFCHLRQFFILFYSPSSFGNWKPLKSDRLWNWKILTTVIRSKFLLSIPEFLSILQSTIYQSSCCAGDDLINKFNRSISLLFLNKTIWLAKTNHVTWKG